MLPSLAVPTPGKGWGGALRVSLPKGHRTELGVSLGTVFVSLPSLELYSLRKCQDYSVWVRNMKPTNVKLLGTSIVIKSSPSGFR